LKNFLINKFGKKIEIDKFNLIVYVKNQEMSSSQIEFLTARIEALETIIMNGGEKSSTPRKSKKKQDGEEKKPRPLSGYQIYCNANREAVKNELEANSSDGKLARGAVLAELGAMWKALSDEQQQGWKEKATKAKEGQSDDEGSVKDENTGKVVETKELEVEEPMTVEEKPEKPKKKKEKKKE
jgi:hypothetical protein